MAQKKEWEDMSKNEKMFSISALVLLVVFIIVIAITFQKGAKGSERLTDALRKCTVMEAADIHTTGIYAKTDNAFNDARKNCNNSLTTVYKNDNALFISESNIDWQNRKSEVIEGKNLEHYLTILER